MRGPLVKLERAQVLRAYHTFDQDALRLEFEGGIVLIAYNNTSVNGVALSVSAPSLEFTGVSWQRVEVVLVNDDELVLRLSRNDVIRIGLRDSDACGPEAFQMLIPGYPPIVEQNR